MRQVAMVAALAVSVLSWLASPVAADPICQRRDNTTGVCTIWLEDPGTPPSDGPGSDPGTVSGAHASCFWDPSIKHLTRPPAGPVPCSTSNGYWSNSYQCYISLAHPQPEAGDPAWAGHLPGDGAIYACFQPQTDLLVYLWSANPPPSSAGGPSPEQVARQAIASMRLRAIDIGIVPKPGPDSVGLVGMPTWLWVANPDGTSFGPRTVSASAGGITITATAKVEKIVWAMRDGTSVTCTTAGTPYEPRFGRRDSPTCGHTYEQTSSAQPGGVFPVSASSYWVVNWAGAGQSGTIRLDPLIQTTSIRIGELQVLVQ